MDLSTAAFVDTPPDTRRRGPDVVRAVALIGVVVMNYHGYLVLRDPDGGIGTSWIETVFDPFDGVLATRFAATFVLVAGVGVTLLTRRAAADPTQRRDMRWRLVRRGVLLYTLGLLLDVIWPGTIIVYYGAMFVLAAVVFTWRSRWVLVTGALCAIAATSLRLWSFDRNRDGSSTEWLNDPADGDVRGYLFDVMVNGTHPLLPWFAFMCAGIVLGRVLYTAWWRLAAIGSGLVLVAVAGTLDTVTSSDLQDVAASLDPYDRSLAYVASVLGTALIAYAVIDWLADRFPTATDPLRRAGQLTLSLYLAHIVVFKLLVDWLSWIEPGGLDVSLAFAGAYWVVAIAIANAWQRRFGRGPAEYVYRAFGG